MKQPLLSVILCTLLLSLGNTLEAQVTPPHWTKLPLPPMLQPSKEIRDYSITPYFITENTGFVFVVTFTLFEPPALAGNAIYFYPSFITSKLHRTTDGGQTWQYLPYFDSIQCNIRQMYFLSEVHGYLAGSNGVYETNDSGLSWKKISPDNSFYNSIYVSGNTLFAFGGRPGGRTSWGETTPVTYGPLISTQDNGSHWNTIIEAHPSFDNSLQDYTNMSAYVTGNKDNVIVAFDLDKNENMFLHYSVDNGKNWTSYQTDTLSRSKTVGIYCIPHSKDILRTLTFNQETHGMPKDVYQVARSTDFGKTWVTTLPDVESGAWIAGDECVVYISNANEDKQSGPIRSTDGGNTWTYVLGPPFTEIDDFDFHNLSVLGGGSIIYATNGDAVEYMNFYYPSGTCSLWKTTNGGDSTLPSSRSNSTINFSSSRIINDSFNVTIHLPIYFHHSGTMNDVDMIMHYPTISLKLASTTLYNGKSFDVAGSQWPGRAALHFTASDLNGAPDSLLGYANFQWTPFEFACDPVDFDSTDTHSLETPCSGSSNAQSFEGIIGSFKTCGLTSGVAENEIPSAPLDFSIHPNPARSGIQIEISNDPGKLQYELFDELGIAMRIGITSENRYSIDLSGIGDGNYYLRISRGGGGTITKRVVVQK